MLDIEINREPGFYSYLISFFASIIVLTSINPVNAALRECTKEQEMVAEEEAGSLTKWEDIYRSFRRFKYCDDGAVAEGYSDSIVKMLASQWKDLKELHKLVKADKDFRAFILRHIDATTDNADLEKVSDNAKEQCPSDTQKLCDEIRQSADSALKFLRK